MAFTVINQFICPCVSKFYTSIPEFAEFFKRLEVFYASGGVPGGDGDAHALSWLSLTGNILEEFAVDGVDVSHDFGELVLAWFSGKWPAEVGFAGYSVEARPRDVGSITDGKFACVFVKQLGLVGDFTQPFEVLASVFDHSGFEI